MNSEKTIIRLIKLICNYRFYGVLAYLKLRSGKTVDIALPYVKHSIRIRGGTKDKAMFNQIFTYFEYGMDLDFTPRIIIDAGANIGLAAIYFANQYPDAKIISIETEQSNFNALVYNTRNYKNIYPLKRAIYNKSGHVLVIADVGYGESGFVARESEEVPGENIVDKADSITIDELMVQFELDHIDILKIDIEGSEKVLFESGYEHWLPRTRCLIVETHDRMVPGCSASLFNAMIGYDFSCFPSGENFVFTNNQI